MRVGIVSNLQGKGLQVDAELLEAFLTGDGHEVELIQFDRPWEGGGFDLGISLEVVNQHLAPLAPRWWWFPNCEWTKHEYVRPAQRMFERVFAKTKDAERLLRELFHNVEYVGFLAIDRLSSEIPREARCLHVGGDSGFKNTAEVIAAWREYRYWDDREMPPLTVISKSISVAREETPGITFHKQVTPDELIRLQNSHRFHVIPSAYEGWGHALREAQSVGAVLLTTGAGPMAELCAPFEVPPVGHRKNNLGTLYEVSPRDIRERVPAMLEQPFYELAKMGMEARARFVAGNKAFQDAFRRALEPRGAIVGVPGTPEVPSRPRIALLGNFGAPHSTENELAWSLRDLGYPVTQFQENEDSTEDILEGSAGHSLLLYIHTHGWVTPGKMSVDELIVRLRANGVKTASFHLDRYFGLNKADGREDRVGTHPFWRTDAVFTADGGNQDAFRSRGVNHYWLPPGVVKRDCFVGEYRRDLAIEVGFVGAEGYHPEYDFRPKLIQFLRDIYGERFRLFQGYRGKALNDAYASIRVVVGDSCFGGQDYYWSDRVPETLGRGGFLIHPAVRGLTIPGLACYTPGNLYELQDKIDWFLANEEARQASVQVTRRWVRENETYNERMVTLLGKMGIA